jgi:predicted DNA-binding transcriptional regulator YafY
VLEPGFTLAPLMLSIAEVEALTLGALWVGERADAGAKTRRVVRPMAITDFDAALILVARRQTRVAFRHFRVDRIETAEERPERHPRRRRALLADWKTAETGRQRPSS